MLASCNAAITTMIVENNSRRDSIGNSLRKVGSLAPGRRERLHPYLHALGAQRDERSCAKQGNSQQTFHKALH